MSSLTQKHPKIRKYEGIIEDQNRVTPQYRTRKGRKTLLNSKRITTYTRTNNVYESPVTLFYLRQRFNVPNYIFRYFM